MRLRSLWIEDWRNLRDFRVDFDAEATRTVLLGANGTAKSNLLEALVIAFRNLDLNLPPEFRYELAFECRGAEVEINSDPSRDRGRTRVRVNGKSFGAQRLSNRPAGHDYLPSYVFGYYSGASKRMAPLFSEHARRAQAKLDQDEFPLFLRRLFYARALHSQFALLTFFAHPTDKSDRFLRDYLHIEGFDSALLVLGTPPKKRRGGDPRFWNWRGAVVEFLERVHDRALAPMRLPYRWTDEFGTRRKESRLYLYLPHLESIRDLADSYYDKRLLFRDLEATHLAGMLRELRLTVTRDGRKVAFAQMSEGEQQLLTVLGLLRFTQTEESLFLLDEPDTHLNPKWSLEYLDLLDSMIGDDPSSQILLTTHDPLTFAGTRRHQVRIFSIDSADAGSRIVAATPAFDPRGLGVEGILTSDLFDLDSALDPPTLRSLVRKRQLQLKERLTHDEQDELDRLTKELGSVDMSLTARDPFYAPFALAVNELIRQNKVRHHLLRPDPKFTASKLAREVLQELNKLVG